MKKVIFLTLMMVLALHFAVQAKELEFETLSVTFDDNNTLTVEGDLKDANIEAVMLQVLDGTTIVEARTAATMKELGDTSNHRSWYVDNVPLESNKKYTLKMADFAGGTWFITDFVTPKKDPVAPISGDDDTSYPKPAKTGTWNDPVTGGNWKQDKDGAWTYTTNATFRNTWGYIQYTDRDGKVQTGWFYFDANGKMLTGWQQLGGKWYYLDPRQGGSYGMCLLNTTTPDGYKVDANGAWIP